MDSVEMQGPPLADGFNLVEGEPRFKPLLRGAEGVVWIDAGNRASTYGLAAVDERLLDRTRIGRAFTAFQHFELVSRLDGLVGEDTDTVVAPSFDLLYREGQAPEGAAEELFMEALSRLASVSRRDGVRVLASVETDLGFAAEAAADRRIEMEESREGLRWSAGDAESAAYRAGPGTLQTTFRFHGEGGERWEEPTRPTATASTT